MRTDLTREQIIDLLENVLGTYVVPSSKVKDNIQFCCTVHGEKNPSAGIHVEKQIFHCFSCHASGDISWLLFKSLDNIKSVQQADEFLKERYGVDIRQIDFKVREIKRYEDFIGLEEEINKRFELPRVKLAPYKSGKETYQYFFDRGFTKQTVKEFMIGRDVINKTITIPLFWEDNTLCGVIGRYVIKRPKNSRYKIYHNTPVGDILYPLHKFEPIDNTVILVEGILDALWLHQLGFKNALATLTNSMTRNQAEIVKKLANKFIDMSDNDERGSIATEKYKKYLLRDMIGFTVKHAYPEGKKDPQECTKEEIEYMLNNKRSILLPKKLKRL
ncbi:MAG: toprim domain-containing protein [Thermosipho sp. (in: Bacteria)]|nr:toprim domain-containing protein [Thermosipho sp. (in: thermotogales)]